MAKFKLNEKMNVFLFSLPLCVLHCQKNHFAAKINHILHVDAKVTNDKFIQRVRVLVERKKEKKCCVFWKEGSDYK